MEPYEILLRVKEGKPTSRKDLDRARSYYQSRLAEYRDDGWAGLVEVVERDLAILANVKAYRKAKPREKADILRDLEGARSLGDFALVAEYESELVAAMDGLVYGVRTKVPGYRTEGQQVGLEV